MNQHIRTIAILGAGAVGSYLVMGKSLGHRRWGTKRPSRQKWPEYQ